MVLNRNYIELLMRVGVVIFLSILISALAPTAGVAGLTVNSTADNDDGSCDPLSVGDCTLREAINAVNNRFGKKIDFDATIFPHGTDTHIMVGSALPAIIESGTTVDGSGTGVVINGGLLVGSEDGLVFESGFGTALTKVTVHSIVVRDFPGSGIYICGGIRPGCSNSLSQTKVSHVTVIGNGSGGIWIDGSYNDQATILHSYAAENGSRGIYVGAEQDLTKTQVSKCTVVLNGSRGIHLNSGDNNVKAQLTGNTASRNSSRGIYVNAGNHMIKLKLTGNTSYGNGSRGINVNAGDNMVLPKLSENHAAGNSSTGIFVNSGNDFLGGQLKDNVATGNGTDGIYINGLTSLVKVKVLDNRAVNNVGHGIRLEGSRNIVKNNIVSDNRADGIRLDGTGQSNKIQGNRARGNDEMGIRIQINSTNAQIKGNEALGNGLTDLVDENLGCDANTWRRNTFVTRNETCIE